MTDNTGRDYVRAEENHLIPELRLPASVLEHQPQITPKRADLVLPHNAFEIAPILSSKECDGLIKVAEDSGFRSISWEYDPMYRCCTRLVVKMPELAAELWRRVRPHLHPEDVSNARPFGYGISETDVWRPYGVNPCIRFTKYVVGDHFALHRDGPFVLTDEERSVYTLMVYLNDSFEYTGGETRFAKEINPAAKTLTPEESETVRGGKGNALLFEHNMWHEGCVLTKGVKYILRTDLMFVRIAMVPMSPALRYNDEAKYTEAENLFQESIRLQKAGDAAGSTTAYLAALDIHASLARVKPKYGPEYSLMPLNVMLEIFLKMLSLPDLVHRVSLVSRGWCALARHSTLWKKLFRLRWKAWYIPLERTANPALPDKTSLKDWHMLYRARHSANMHFRVIYLDVGSLYMRYSMLGSSEHKIQLASVMRVSGHYWTAGSGLHHHQCGFSCLRWLSEGDIKNVFTDSGTHLERFQILLRWVLLEGFATRLTPQEHPMLLARAPEMTNADCTQLGDWMRTLLGVPCVAWVHPAICCLAALDHHSGLVLNVTHRMVEVTAVLDEQIVVTKSAKLAEKLTVWSVTLEDGFCTTDVSAAVLAAWVIATNKLLVDLVKQVLNDLGTHSAKPDILATPYLRGLCGSELLRGGLASELSNATGGVVPSVTLCNMRKKMEPAKKKTNAKVSRPRPDASTDIAKGLGKLCSSVERAQKLFALNEPPAVKFNRPLLLWVATEGNGYMQRYTWRRHELADLRSWWHAFADQLAVATCAKLVRIMWSNGEVSEMQEMVKFKKEVHDYSVLLMIWVDFDSHWLNSDKDRADDRELGIYWVHTFMRTPEPHPDTYVRLTENGRSWFFTLPATEAALLALIPKRP